MIEHDAIVVNKSTVPVGSTLVVERLLRRSDLSVVSEPGVPAERGPRCTTHLHPGPDSRRG